MDTQRDTSGGLRWRWLLLAGSVLVAVLVIAACQTPLPPAKPVAASKTPTVAVRASGVTQTAVPATATPSPVPSAPPTLTPTITATLSPSPTRVPVRLSAANADRLQATIQLSYPGYVLASAAFSADTRSFVFGLTDGTVQLWRVGTQAPILAMRIAGSVGAKSPIAALSVALSAANDSMAAGGANNKVDLWRFAALDKPVEGGHGGVVRAVAISKDGRLLASGSIDKNVQIRQVSDGKQLGTLSGHSAAVNSLAFSPDGALLASGSEDRSVDLWQMSDRKLLRRLPGHQDTVYSVAFSPSSQILATGSDTVRLWQINAPGLPQVLERPQALKGPLKALAFSPDGDLLAAIGSNNYIALWQMSDGKALAGIACSTCGPSFLTIAFADDGLSLSAASSGNQIIWWTAP
jgi:WD40 repeat protein